MARQFFGFFDSSGADIREYVADDFAQVLRGFFGDGVQSLGSNLQVVPGADGLTTQITPGLAAIQGYMYGLFDDGGDHLQLVHVEADALPRIDRVILRLDRANGTRSISPMVLRGTPDMSPLPPALTRNGIVWEISLAQVSIAAAAETVYETDITDERVDGTVCGVIEPHRIKEYVNQGVKTTDTPTFAGLNVPISTIAGLQNALDDKAAVSHTQAIDTITGLQTALDGKAATSHTQTIDTITGLQAALNGILALAYPVGSIYLSVRNVNPSSLFGGTWVAWGTGRVPVAVDTGQAEFNAPEKTGGAKTHTLATTEMPSHSHPLPANLVNALGEGSPAKAASGTSLNFAYNYAFNTGSIGSGGAHNNLQPYITCYMWKRTA
jgi:hypothetical protein